MTHINKICPCPWPYDKFAKRGQRIFKQETEKKETIEMWFCPYTKNCAAVFVKDRKTGGVNQRRTREVVAQNLGRYRLIAELAEGMRIAKKRLKGI